MELECRNEVGREENVCKRVSVIERETETHLDTSLWEFLSPSKVKGDAPVNNSNMRIPKLHQSTDCRHTEHRLIMGEARDGSKQGIMQARK